MEEFIIEMNLQMLPEVRRHIFKMAVYNSKLGKAVEAKVPCSMYPFILAASKFALEKKLLVNICTTDIFVPVWIDVIEATFILELVLMERGTDGEIGINCLIVACLINTDCSNLQIAKYFKVSSRIVNHWCKRLQFLSQYNRNVQEAIRRKEEDERTVEL